MSKGVSPILASVLIVLVAISLSGAFLVFTQSTSTQLTEGAQESQEQLQAELDVRPVIEGVADNTIFLRNGGSDNITHESIDVFLGDVLINHTIPVEIASNGVGEVHISDTWKAGLGETSLQVSSGSLADSVRVRVGKPGMVMYLSFDDGSGTNVFDESGNGHNGTLFNGPVWTDGRFGGGLQMDGVDDNVQVSDSPQLDVVFGDTLTFTLEGWVNMREWDNYGTVVNKAEQGWWSSSTAGLWAWGDGLTGVVATNECCNPSGSHKRATYKPSLNEWHHVAAVGNETHVTLYVDGELRDVEELTDYIIDNHSSNDEPVTIGTRSPLSTPEFNGTIDEVVVYSTALSQDELDLTRDDIYEVNSV